MNRPQPTNRSRAHLAEMRRQKLATSIHNEPLIVNRLIRLVEELLERDDLTPDADPGWYRNRLKEIKKEVADGPES